MFIKKWLLFLSNSLKSTFNNKLKIDNDNKVFFNNKRIDKFRKNRRRFSIKSSLYKVNFNIIRKFYVKEDNYETKEMNYIHLIFIKFYLLILCYYYYYFKI